MALFELHIDTVMKQCLKRMSEINCEMLLLETGIDVLQHTLETKPLDIHYRNYILPIKLDQLDDKDKLFHEILLIYQITQMSVGETVWLDSADVVLLDVL